MKKNNTDVNVTTDTPTKTVRQTQPREKTKRTPWHKGTTVAKNYALLLVALGLSIIMWGSGFLVSYVIANNAHTVSAPEDKGTLYTREAVVVATDNTLHTVEDSDGTLWLVDNGTLRKGDTLLLYIADNDTHNTQRDDVIVRVWRDTVVETEG
jgi:hypothetical protein